MMLAIGEDNAAKLFQRMDDEEIKEMSQNMANLGTIPAPLVEAIFIEFSERLSSTGSLVGSYESTERLLAKVLPKDRAMASMEALRGPAGRPVEGDDEERGGWG